MPENYLIFLQIILFMFITPGAPRVLIMSHSLNYGFKNSLWTAFGDISANTLQMLFVLVGLGALIKIFPNIVIYCKWIGVVYLLYIAFGYIKNSSKIKLTTETQKKTIWSLYLDGFFIAFFSPKAIVFFMTIFPTLIPVGENYLRNCIIFWLTYIILDFLTLAIYSAVVNRISVVLKANPKTLNYISSAALIATSLVIAIKV